VHSRSTGLLAALFLALCPGHVAASSIGIYDHRSSTVLWLLLGLCTWARALHQGSTLWAALSALCYLVLALLWRGHPFLANAIPLHTALCCAAGLYTARLHAVYSTWALLSVLLSVQVPGIGSSAIFSWPLVPLVAVLGTLQVYAALLSLLHAMPYQARPSPLRSTALGSIAAIAGLLFATQLPRVLGVAPPLSWLWGLLDPAALHDPAPGMVPPVSQPPCWAMLFEELHVLLLLAPTGLLWCIRHPSTGSLLVVVFPLAALCLASLMAPLLALLAPALCLLASLSVCSTFHGPILALLHDPASTPTSAGVVPPPLPLPEQHQHGG